VSYDVTISVSYILSMRLFSASFPMFIHSNIDVLYDGNSNGYISYFGTGMPSCHPGMPPLSKIIMKYLLTHFSAVLAQFLCHNCVKQVARAMETYWLVISFFLGLHRLNVAVGWLFDQY